MAYDYDAYDYVIVGGGPAGLTLAYGLEQYGHAVALVEAQASLGGCHRVFRTDPLTQPFREHGPRLYVSNYHHVRMVYDDALRDSGVRFDDLFVPYAFGLTLSNVWLLLREIPWRDAATIAASQAAFVLYGGGTRPDETVAAYAARKRLAPATRDLLDRFCRMSDGADASRYLVRKFFDLVDQNYLYRTLQPRLPTDVELIPLLAGRLRTTRLVTGTRATRLDAASRTVTLADGTALTARVGVVLAVPPVAVAALLEASGMADAFGSDYAAFARQTQYMTFLPVTFHWDTALAVAAADAWGYPRGPWKVAFVPLSQYMRQVGRSPTLVSAVVTDATTPSDVTGRSANDTRDAAELGREVWRQIAPHLGLPPPDRTLLSPELRRSDDDTRWVTADTPYVQTRTGCDAFRPPQSPRHPWLYQVGTQNGASSYAFTSMETAVASAVAVLHQLEPASQRRFPSQAGRLWTLSYVVRLTLVMTALAVVVAVWAFRRRRGGR
jgi:hypothetical protein